jgi:DNA mismatch repair protein MutL
MTQTNPSRRIHILRGEVAKKIAAGEVIDRPFSVLRELIDNAIDAGASSIEVRIEGGGTSLIQVRDNGDGMSGEDLELCWQSHATSKISHEDDLLKVRTLGFRGEALASISAVSRLEIVSRRRDDEHARSVTLEGGSSPRYGTPSADTGTRVSVRNLFFNLPARRKFIKSPGAETRLCRTVLLEKAVAHPGVEFRFFTDGTPRDLLPAVENRSLLARIAELYPAQCPRELLREVRGAGEGFMFTAVIGIPPLHRSDRKFMHIYCNTRRINEFSLIHAAEYAMSDLLPGGTYPVAFVFLEVDPAEVDFNIHPAKREARFTRPDMIHRAVREAIQGELRQFVEAEPEAFADPGGVLDFHRGNPGDQGLGTPPSRRAAFDYHSQFDRRHGENEPVTAERPPAPSSASFAPGPHRDREESAEYLNRPASIPPYRYLGQVFSLFLAVEMGDSLYMIDMHAAHERILFEAFRASKPREELLIPILIENDDPLLSGRCTELAAELKTIGFDARASENGDLEITAVPGALRGTEGMLRQLLGDLGASVKDLETRLYENMACRSAVKDGDVVDADTARFIIEESWRLPVKRCPHGRPIWFRLTRDELFQLVGRVV